MSELIYHRLEFSTTSRGLGIKVAGGKVDENYFGIFVKRIIMGGAVFNNKNIHVGDQIIDVNGINLLHSSLSRAVNILRRASASGHVSITFGSGSLAKSNFSKFLKSSETLAQKKLRHSFNGLEISEMERFIEQPEKVAKSSSLRAFENLEKTIEFRKSTAGIGFKVQEKTCPMPCSCCNQVSLLLIAALSPGGDSYEDGRLKVGDYLTRINGHCILKYNANQVHSLLLREKLRHESTFQLSFIPATVPVSSIADAIHHSKQFCVASTKHSNSSTHQQAIKNQINYDPSFSSSVSTPRSSDSANTCRRRRLSIDGSTLIEIDKLYAGLNYLGYSLTDDQYKSVDKDLIKDENNAVKYADFVTVIRKVCNIQMHPIYLFESSVEELNEKASDTTEAMSNSSAAVVVDENLKNLYNKLEQQEKKNEFLQKKVEKLELEHQQVIEKYELALKQSRQETDHMRYDYEEVIKVLEAELEVLQSSEVSLAKVDSESEYQKQISLVECECRKLSDSRDALTIKLESLLAFTNKVVQSDVKSFVKYNKSHEAIETIEKLAKEAEQLYIDVRRTMQLEDLPYGWEEATLGDGRVYFIDHHTHTTSWNDPRKVTATTDDAPIPNENNLTSLATANTGDGTLALDTEKLSENGLGSEQLTPRSTISSPAAFPTKLRLI